MKKLLITLILLMSLCFCACGQTPSNIEEKNDEKEENNITCFVTFVQEGQEDIVKVVEVGGTLTGIPNPTVKQGYTVVWNRTDFTNITENITVSVTSTPNNYTISYFLDNENANISSTTQTVTFDSNFELLEPTNQVDTFLGWYIKDTNTKVNSGTWNYANNLEVVAKWQVAPPVNTCTITFIQEGQENVIKTVNEGETLTDIPTPATKTGYTVVWDITDFSDIREDMTVNAVETAKEYTITYILGKDKATISSTTQTVTLNEEFKLLIPSCSTYDFLYWKIKGTDTKMTSGTWDKTENIELVAVWGEMWTPNY